MEVGVVSILCVFLTSQLPPHVVSEPNRNIPSISTRAFPIRYPIDSPNPGIAPSRWDYYDLRPPMHGYPGYPITGDPYQPSQPTPPPSPPPSPQQWMHNITYVINGPQNPGSSGPIRPGPSSTEDQSWGHIIEVVPHPSILWQPQGHQCLTGGCSLPSNPPQSTSWQQFSHVIGTRKLPNSKLFGGGGRVHLQTQVSQGSSTSVQSSWMYRLLKLFGLLPSSRDSWQYFIVKFLVPGIGDIIPPTPPQTTPGPFWGTGGHLVPIRPGQQGQLSGNFGLGINISPGLSTKPGSSVSVQSSWMYRLLKLFGLIPSSQDSWYFFIVKFLVPGIGDIIPPTPPQTTPGLFWGTGGQLESIWSGGKQVVDPPESFIATIIIEIIRIPLRLYRLVRGVLVLLLDTLFPNSRRALCRPYYFTSAVVSPILAIFWPKTAKWLRRLLK